AGGRALLDKPALRIEGFDLRPESYAPISWNLKPEAPSETLHSGPQVELQGPGGRVLGMKLPVGFGDGVGREQGVVLAVREHAFDSGGVDLAVHYDVRD